MPSAIAHALQKRPFHLDRREPLSAKGIWFDGKPMTTQLLNAYTLLVPEGERFVIRSCRREMHKADPALREELNVLFFQEGSHSREHGRLMDAMGDEGLALRHVRRFIEWMSYRVIERMTPSILKVATAAAIEHHNAVIATHFLEQDLLRRVQPGETRRLLVWHFAEEIEHKETTFKLLQQLSPSWIVRALGLLVSATTFLSYLAVYALLLGIRTRAALTWTFWREASAAWLDRRGLARMLARESWRYLTPGFAPRVAESRELLDRALAELERLGVERPTPRPAPVRRDTPPAFRRRMASSLERVAALRPGNAYFEAPIEGYDGAWVVTKSRRKLNFCTYSYLGLLGHPTIQDAATRALERYGTGTHGVRLLGGSLEIHVALETRIASFFHREAALTFSSGFITNAATIAALTGKGDFVLSDASNHASIVDGCRLSRAKALTFRHNDMHDLAARLDRLPRDARKLVVVDAVFSMDGDIAPLDQLIAIRDRCPNTMLMVDEAHSLGVLGSHGRGIEEHFNCVGAIDVLMGTLSKTIPAQGGYIAGSLDLITFLRYNARGFVFSASLPPATTAAALAGLDLIESEGPARRERLLSNVARFVGRLRHAGFDVGRTESAIVPILLGDEARAFDLASRCHLEHVYAMPVAYPAVPRGTERLRMNVTSNHRLDDLDFAVSALTRARNAAACATPLAS